MAAFFLIDILQLSSAIYTHQTPICAPELKRNSELFPWGLDI